MDAGFLELVRYGVLSADDRLVVDSVDVVDRVLRVETPAGPVWRRYNHDGYGQRTDGSAYQFWGQGRAWPLLTGERGHYALAAGHSPKSFIQALEHFATPTGLLPEQVWDDVDLPEKHMYLGRPTGSAMPLAWAHAEYLKLIRSVSDGVPFDRVPEVHERYVTSSRKLTPPELWSFAHPVRSILRGRPLRLHAPAPFRVRYTCDDWQTHDDVAADPTKLDIFHADLAIPADAETVIFTFYWTAADHWEGRDFSVTVRRSSFT